VLVGHSYGGNVISAAAIGNEQVRALVYLNGWMCDVGEIQQQLLEGSKAAWWGPRSGPLRSPTPTAARALIFTSPRRPSTKPSPPTSMLPRPQ
jgi:pimeloyl-ACP methyl ester carboxylesterase